MSASIIHTYVFDLSKKTPFKKHINKWSPFLQVSYKPINKEDMYIKAFVKHSFRLPSFNDMYYQLVGNVNLLPENALQSNLSVSYSKYIHRVLPYVSVSTDVYYNRVKDKIVAIPNKNLFVWSMINVGEVSIFGVDMRLSSEWEMIPQLSLETTVNYTFQQAIDISNPSSKVYKHQIPYTPKHVLSGIVACHTKWINVSYTLLYAGKRYVLTHNTPENLLESYVDHGISIYRGFSIKKTDLYLHFDILNIANSHYEVVKSYPMVGRQFQGKITYKF
ncbi:MAG: TonB-dependent receptor [Bacteroidales bacterium]|nr:TonB-dependent receptor [Bacteroidales bacterium]